MTDPLVSIIIPAYDPGPFLSEALDSLLNQTYGRCELIIIDDGSSSPCSNYMRDLSSATLYVQENKGPAAARNAGVAMARGEYLAFHDADDLCLPKKIMKQMQVLLSSPEVGFVLTKIQNFLHNGVESPDWFRGEEKMKDRLGFVCTMVVRRECFELVGNFDETYRIGEDVDWLIRAHDLGVGHVCLPEALYHRRVHDTNISADIRQGHENLAEILRSSIARRRESNSRAKQKAWNLEELA